MLKGKKVLQQCLINVIQIITERLTGFARLLRSNAMAAMENVALWHERDISHSSVERIIIPDSTNLMDYMLIKVNKLFEHLIIYPENMLKNLNLTNGLIFSQEVLLMLVQKGVSREDAYKIVQECALKTWNEKTDFRVNLLSHPTLSKFNLSKKIDQIFTNNNLFKNVDLIFKRVI